MLRKIILTVFMVAIVSPVAVVLACASGGYEFVDSIEDIAHYDLIVAATVHDVDDAGIGHILKVERYFKGSGGEFLVRMPYGPALQAATRVRLYDTGCHYDGRQDPRIQVNDFGYLGLGKTQTGQLALALSTALKTGSSHST